jgi:drug/metabolite transporter (DMT)-like permease
MNESVSHDGKSTSFPVILALVAAALFGAATPASKLLLGDLSVFQLAGFLYLGAALGVAVVLLRQQFWPTGLSAESHGAERTPFVQSPLEMNRANRLRLGGAVFFGGILGPVLLLFGLKLASAASVSLWLNWELVATAILGRFFFRDHLGRFGWIGVVGVTLSGALLGLHEGIAGLWSGLLVAGACLCWGIDNHLTALIDGITPTQSTFWKGLVAGSANLLIGVIVAPLDAAMSDISIALLIGVFSYGASIALYITAAQGIGATRAQMFFASAPFFGVALSAVILQETISTLQAASALLLTLSLTLLFRDQHGHFHRHKYFAHQHSHRHNDGHHDHPHPGMPSNKRHSHWHEHTPIAHSHPHWPDLHHRHRHTDDKDDAASDE